MTPNEINKRIAIACGWEIHPKDRFIVIPPNSPNSVRPLSTIPNYHGDLNAMHEAEKMLTEKQWDRFELSVGWMTGDRGFCKIHANAARRAEAFLRTIGQWEDGK
jgi:hypothetical protein